MIDCDRLSGESSHESSEFQHGILVGMQRSDFESIE